MLIAVKSVLGITVQGPEEPLGTVKDLLFDEGGWAVRYLVLDTGKWLPGRRVLLSPRDVDKVDWTRHYLFVRQTRYEIENSPSLNEHEPVSRRRERELVAHFQWPAYWTGPVPLGPMPAGGILRPEPSPDPERIRREIDAATEEEDTCLRSAKELISYHMEATDGRIGHIEDFIFDENEDWLLRYLVVDTQPWLPGGSVLIAVGWVESIDWETQKIHVELTREQIKGGPEYHPSEPVNRRYEEMLYDYYGRPAYWS